MPLILRFFFAMLNRKRSDQVRSSSEHEFVDEPLDSVSESTTLAFKRHRVAVIFQDWWLELLSCLVATTALAVVFAITYRFHNRTLLEWHGMLSINSVLSISAVIMRGSISLVIAQGKTCLNERHTCYNA